MRVFTAVSTTLALLLLAGPVAAQQGTRGSRYLPTDSWAYDAITQLRTRGLLTRLDPLAQPYSRDEIAAALAATDTSALSAPLRHYLRLLRDELRPELRRMARTDSLALGFAAFAGGNASSTRSQDPLMPIRGEPAYSNSRAWPYYALEGWAERGAVAVDIRLYHDLYLEGNGRGDPFGSDPGGIIVLNRTDNAYVAASNTLGTLFLGRMRRNWAPLGEGGLMISDVATSFPQLGLDLGGRNVALRFFAGELDAIDNENRYMAANSIEYRSDRFAISIGEAKVFTSSGGLRLRDLNPAELMFFEQDLAPVDQASNLVLNGTLWWDVGGTTLRGEGLLDDIDVAPAGADPEPLLFALSGGVRNTSLLPGIELGLDYELVAANTYRTLHFVDQWSLFGRGLGANYSDFDRLTLSATLLPRIPGLRLMPVAQLQRKGEGDFRLPLPDSTTYVAGRTIFLGVREATVRAGLRGRYQPTRHAFAEWDAGINFVRNAGHERGRKLTEFQGAARVGFEWTTGGGR